MSRSLPAELPLEHTLQFLHRMLPSPPLRLLEVGCGDGALAERLRNPDCAVTAIDSSRPAVLAAHQRHVPAFETDFFDYREGFFDVLLFSRSLHHLAPLTEAVEHAHRLLAPGGTLIAEEFAIENVDRETARWFFELSDLLEATGLIPAAPAAVVPASNQLERWYEEHAEQQPVHSGEDMTIAIGCRLELVSQERGPYLFRYICDRIEPTDRGVRVARWVRDVESLRVAEGSLRPAGLRLVARKAGTGRDDFGRPAPLAS